MHLSLAGKKWYTRTCWQTFLMLASYVTNLKHAGSLTTLTSTAGWESDSFKILLAGGEERVFFSQQS